MTNPIKRTGTKLFKSEKIRFGLVGIVNTATDFATLNVLVGLFGLSPIPANIVSTTTAMLVSFTLNKRAVFQGSDKGGARQIMAFFAVTLCGIWLVQTSILAVVHTILIHTTHMPEVLSLNIAKITGTCLTLIWNYLWYSRYVFKSGSSDGK